MKVCKAVLITEQDTVLTVLEEVKPGEYADTGSEKVMAQENIPQYHKIARFDICRGDRIYKYGQPMGYAIMDIKQGQWVHTHNADSEQPEGDEV